MNTDSTGMTLYYNYYICDFIFILAFGILQSLISKAIFKDRKSVLFRHAVVLISLRALCDSAENILLINIIRSYPTLNDTAVKISSVISTCKFAFMGIWFAFLLAGTVTGIIRKRVHRQIN
ncbi:MAG: hypothetical protein Q4F95_09985 [Oscillospiraceae bacterium]|nr:hypothetical protein [Oscillospiraceae bacterium]